MSVHTPEDPASDLIPLTATMEAFIPSFNSRLIAVSSEWLSEYNTSSMGTIHDRFILAFDKTRQK